METLSHNIEIDFKIHIQRHGGLKAYLSFRVLREAYSNTSDIRMNITFPPYKIVRDIICAEIKLRSAAARL